MPVTIIKGCIGSGKTRYCIEEMKKMHNAHPERRCIMLVPSHYSHVTEQLLIDEFGGTGLNNIIATSLEKLSRELVISPQPRIGASGRYALISYAIKLFLNETDETQYDAKLLRSARKPGFTDVCASLLSELNRYNVTPEMLLKNAEECEDGHLKQKLALLSGIGDKYRILISESDFSDNENTLSEITEIIPQAFSPEDNIWVDNFDEFLPAQLEVIRELILTSANITITMSICPDYNDTYYGTKKAIYDITSLCDATVIELEGGMGHIKAPDLKFLFDNWHNGDSYPQVVKNAQIFTARDAYTEVEHIATKILDLVREEGYRFGEIGIISSDPEGYSHILSAIFNEYDIPYYGDETISISEHPIAMQILSLFNVIETNWDYESMFSYLRSGFIYRPVLTPEHKTKYIRLNPNHIDLLENHVLKYGINRKNAWERKWTRSDNNILDTAFSKEQKEDDTLEWLDNLRQTVIAPISAYSEKIREAKTVSDYCHALYEFLENTNLYRGLRAELLSTAVNLATAEAQRMGQVWNLLLDCIDEVENALGAVKTTHSEFAEFIQIAFTQCQIRTIPSGIDRVFVGAADMNRALPTRAIFAIGAVAGTYPTVSTQEGYFSNSEREFLEASSLRLAPTTHKKAEKLRNTVYKLLSHVTEKLYITYPSMTADSKSCLPSQMILDIMQKLPNIPQYDDMLTNQAGAFYVSSPRATLHKLLTTPGDHPIKGHLTDWYKAQELWRDRFLSIERARRDFTFRTLELDEELAKELYRDFNRYSATRLNTYANCPFAHYLGYGLEAKEREEFSLNAKDTGTYAHQVIERLCTKIDTDPQLDWKTVTDEKCDEIVSGIVAEAIENVTASDLRDKEMTADILRRMGETVKVAARTTVRSIASGDFVPFAYEEMVYVKLAEDVEVGGKIDRLDVCRHDGVSEFRIIDYKTGSQSFNVADIYNGIDMQPVIYALAMRMLYKDATISGMYYGLVHNYFANIDVTSRPQTAQSRLKKNTELSGITFISDDASGALDRVELDRVESEYQRNQDSLFFKMKDGEVVLDSRVKSREDGELLMEHVRNRVLEVNKEIRGGKISVSPMGKGTRSHCSYCEYKSVCRFDERFKTEREITESEAQVWDILRGEES